MSADIARTNISNAWLHLEKIYCRKSQQPRGLAAKNGPISGGKVGQVIEQALRRLREDDLESAYREASAADAPDWDTTTGDGLSHETW
jgi:hypothetical protein